eukprot:scaffold140335_cov145-Phaeocystis_antarctica.AAC.1
MGTAWARHTRGLARGGSVVTTHLLQLVNDVTHSGRVHDLISEGVHLATQIEKPRGKLHRTEPHE